MPRDDPGVLHEWRSWRLMVRLVRLVLISCLVVYIVRLLYRSCSFSEGGSCRHSSSCAVTGSLVRHTVAALVFLE